MTPFVRLLYKKLREDALPIHQVPNQGDTGWDVFIPEEKDLILEPGLTIVKTGIHVRIERIGFDLAGYLREPQNHKQAQIVQTVKHMIDYMFDNQFRPWIQVRDKSGKAAQGLSIEAGIVDHGYAGELLVMITNNTDEPTTIEAGKKLTQIIPMLTPIAEAVETDCVLDTTRGAGAMGSTGI